ncbi:MAG: RIP metalloprotease RseP [Capnocytophaga sp.]|nr:RIP metalloprotease RseP [Capnocytophaga sp.]
METFFIKAAQLILSLSILIVLHELGHFIPAKIFKTRVEKFFLFFDVKFALFKKKIGETVYGIGWLPLGGYVKIAGMIDESMDKEQMAQPPQPWEFRSKPAWQRLIIMIGGVTVNLILGFLIYIMILFVWGENQIKEEGLPGGFYASSVMKSYGFEDGDIVTEINGKPLENLWDINKAVMLRDASNLTVKAQNGQIRQLTLPDSVGKQLFNKGEMIPFRPRIIPEIDSLMPDMPAAKAGFAKGDRIVAINDIPVGYHDEVEKVITAFPKGSSLTVEIDRNGTHKLIEVIPDTNNKLGFASANIVEIKHHEKKFGLGEAISEGIHYGYWTLRDYVAQFKYVFTKKGASEVGGFGAIGSMFPSQWDWKAFWHTTAFISIILAFMNILPIPALDGGHVVFLLYEMATGRKPSDKVMEYAQMIGFFILIGLVLYANGNDIYKAIFR